MTDELEYEATAEERRGPRNFRYTRKITLSNYDPRRKFETEDFSAEHDSFSEARKIVEDAVNRRISELSGAKKFITKQ